MTISKEELEKIKKLHQAQDLAEIIKHKKDDDKASSGETSDDSDDENFISNRGSDGKKSDIKPNNFEIRSLDNEVGGLEVDHKKLQEAINKDVDVWDDRDKQIKKGAEESEIQDIDANKSFIHQVKFLAGLSPGKYNKHKRTHLGQVDLDKAADKAEKLQPASYVERLKNLSKDRSHESGGMGL